MTISIDADCALAYWMTSLATREVRKRASHRALAERIESHDLPEWAYAPDGKVHVIATDSEKRLRRKGVQSRLAKTRLPGSSFEFTETGIPVVSPECCFVRLANHLDLPELVKAGMMLCSCFAFDESGCLVERSEPLASAGAIEDYINKLEGVNGVKKARRAVRYVANGAASPAEINAYLLLCLPPRHGGMGCPIPELNGHVKLRPDIARTIGYSDCYCDLLWRKQKCAVEYTSELHHTGYQKQTRDEMRRAALEAMGYRVYLLMKNQLNNQIPFEGFARSVSKAVGKRFPKSSIEYQSAQLELRKHVLYEPSWPIKRASMAFEASI